MKWFDYLRLAFAIAGVLESLRAGLAGPAAADTLLDTVAPAVTALEKATGLKVDRVRLRRAARAAITAWYLDIA